MIIPLLVNPSAEYDWWVQGYRMLSAFISCAFGNDGIGDDSGDSSGDGSGDGESRTRWMIATSIS